MNTLVSICALENRFGVVSLRLLVLFLAIQTMGFLLFYMYSVYCDTKVTTSLHTSSFIHVTLFMYCTMLFVQRTMPNVKWSARTHNYMNTHIKTSHTLLVYPLYSPSNGIECQAGDVTLMAMCCCMMTAETQFSPLPLRPIFLFFLCGRTKNQHLTEM